MADTPYYSWSIHLILQYGCAGSYEYSLTGTCTHRDVTWRKESCHCLLLLMMEKLKRTKTWKTLIGYFLPIFFPNDYVETRWSFLNTAIFYYSVHVSSLSVLSEQLWIMWTPNQRSGIAGHILGISSLYLLPVGASISSDVCSTQVTVLLWNWSPCFHWLS